MPAWASRLCVCPSVPPARFAKERKLRIWRDYVAPTANLDQKDKQFVAKVSGWRRQGGGTRGLLCGDGGRGARPPLLASACAWTNPGGFCLCYVPTTVRDGPGTRWDLGQGREEVKQSGGEGSLVRGGGLVGALGPRRR